MYREPLASSAPRTSATFASEMADEWVETSVRGWREVRGFERLGTQPFRASSTLVGLSKLALTLTEVSGGILLRVEPDPGHHFVSLPQTGYLKIRAAGQDHWLEPDRTGGLGCLRDARQLVLPGGVRFCNLRFEDQVLRAELEKLIHGSVAQPLSFDPLLPLSRGSGPSFARFVRFLVEELEQSESPVGPSSLVISQLERALVTHLLESQPHSYSARLRARAGSSSESQLRAAEEFVAEHLDQAISVGDLARAAGVSARSLREAFRRHRGCTPSQFLLERRLEAARGDLLAGGPGTRVSDVALARGFGHLSRFAAAYGRAFGEKPSETLRRAKR